MMAVVGVMAVMGIGATIGSPRKFQEVPTKYSYSS